MRPTPLSQPASRWLPLAVAVLALTGLPGLASAQSLQELYEAARGFDGTYLAAKALAQSAEYKAAQADALARPSAAVTAGVNGSRSDPPKLTADTTHGASATLSGRYPLFNRANGLTIEQARKGLVTAQADLDSPSRTWWCASPRPISTCWPRRTRWPPRAPARPPRPSNWLRPSATSKSAPPPSPTRAKRRRASTWTPSANWPPRTTCAASASRWTRWSAARAWRPGRCWCPWCCPRHNRPAPKSGSPWPTSNTPRCAVRGWGWKWRSSKPARHALRELPTVDAVASVGGSDLRGSRYSSSGFSNTASVGVQFNWPLYTGGSTQNRIKETLSLEDKARNDLEAARRGIGQGTRVAFFGVQSGLAQVKALEAAEASTKLALEATQLGYKVGVRVNLDVLNAQSQLFATQRDLAKARYDVLMGGLKLRQAAGQLAPADVATVNQLLAK
jgi:outer membrane protein